MAAATISLGGAVLRGAATLMDRVRFRLRHGSAFVPSPPDAIMRGILETLRRDGFALVPDFYDATHCAALRADIDRIITQQPDAVHRGTANADMRVFGAERASALVAGFHHHPFLQGLADGYCGSHLKNLFTLAGRLQFQPGNLGSGEGWHRDAFHFQFKTMVYLTDVGVDDGPFQLVAGSHRPLRVFLDTVRGRLDPAPSSRVSDAQVARILDGRPECLKTFTAKAGTLILFDSSTIHRGAPIRAGMRYALTNYFYLPEQVSPALVEKFAPYAGPNP